MAAEWSVTVDGGGANAAPSVAYDCGGAGSAPEAFFEGGPAGFPEEIVPLSTASFRSVQVGPVVPDEQIVQGDPRLILGPNGARLQFTGGQPLMDQGLENLALISLFTHKGWCGNTFMNLNNAIGSEFEDACNQPITRSSLNRIRNLAVLALSDEAFGTVTVTVTNPRGNDLSVKFLIQPPGGSPQELALHRNGGNWQAQGNNPAYTRVLPPSPTVDAEPTGPNAQHEDWNFMQFEDGTIMEF